MDIMHTTTSAIGYRANLPATDPDALVHDTIPVGELGPHDLLVDVQAVSVNPVDVKLRGAAPTQDLRVLGFDAAGTVVAVGDLVHLFSVGDEVYYAGALDRPGTNQRLHVVDERLVGRRPSRISMAEAAALPLVAITAWEALFDHLGLTPQSQGTLLVIGATGGVGSILVQLAHALLPQVRIIGSASGPARADQLKGLGVADVIDHRQDLSSQVRRIAPDGVSWLFTSYSDNQIQTYADIVKPLGHIVAIDDGPRDVAPLKAKAIAWHWEFMFARSLHRTDMIAQHHLLNQVADLIDSGAVSPVIARVLSPISAETLRAAHEEVETGHVFGKVVLHHWNDEPVG